ncbi:MAG: hypothetical protein H0U77_03840 [Nocardioidaceae bacterium]|nr:hypothetical protein [Nocardioidaceae bacterium]
MDHGAERRRGATVLDAYAHVHRIQPEPDADAALDAVPERWRAAVRDG